MIKYGFFNSKITATGSYDRRYNADDVNKYFEGAFSEDGIFEFVGNQCRVAPNSGMNIIVTPGKGMIKHHWFTIDSNEKKAVAPAHATLNRYTAIAMRYDSNGRNISLVTINGTPAEYPVKPLPVRGETVRDIILAYIYIPAGSTEIVASNITDTVEDGSVCGYVRSLLESDSSGVICVKELPEPNASRLGKIYYLEEEWNAYEIGYYQVKAGDYRYIFDTEIMVADTLDNRPVATAEYETIRFFATDTNELFRCDRNEDGDWMWYNIIVYITASLPQGSSATVGKRYLVGNTLYIGIVTPGSYKWAPIGGGNAKLVNEYIDQGFTELAYSTNEVAPINAEEGDIYFNSTESKFYKYSLIVGTEPKEYDWELLNVEGVAELPEYSQSINGRYYVSNSVLFQAYNNGKVTDENDLQQIVFGLEKPSFVDKNTIYICKKDGKRYFNDHGKISNQGSGGGSDDWDEGNFLYSVIVDEANSDPIGSVTYADDCEGFTPASKSTYGDWESFVKSFFKPCLLKTTDTIGQPSYYLNHDIRRYKEDGNLAIKDGTDGDCMIEVKSLWYSFENLDDNRYKLSISDSKRGVTWENFNGYIQDGEYKESEYIYLPCYISPNGNVMQSIAGSPVSIESNKPEDWRSKASAKGTGYYNLDYRRVLLLQCMMLLLGKSLDTQTQFGGVWKDSMILPGSLDEQKFISTDVFLGIEGLFNGRTSGHGAYIDRITKIANDKVKWTDDLSKYDTSGNGYENAINVVNMYSGIAKFISKIIHNNKGGFNPTEASGSATTYYCDHWGSMNQNYPHQYLFGVSQGSSDSSFTYSGAFAIYTGTFMYAYGTGRICRLY